MELEVQQTPQSPRTFQVSQQPLQPKNIDYGESFRTLDKLADELREKQKQNIKTQNTEIIDACLNKHREEVIAIFNRKITTRLVPLQKENSELKEEIKTLSEHHKTSIATANRHVKAIGFGFLCTALGLSINFIMLAYLWYYTHK